MKDLDRVFDLIWNLIEDQCGIPCGDNNVYALNGIRQLPYQTTLYNRYRRTEEKLCGWFYPKQGDCFLVTTNNAGVEENREIAQDILEMLDREGIVGYNVRKVTARKIVISEKKE